MESAGREFFDVNHPIDPRLADDGGTQQRLENLLRLNAEIELDKSRYHTDRERLEAATMKRPLDSRRAYALFGFMLGTIPSGLIGVTSLFSSRIQLSRQMIVMIALFSIAFFVTGGVGFATGKYIPGALNWISHLRFPNRVAMTILIGFLWGAISGGTGGLFLFLIGAIFGGIIGGIVGAISLPIFAALHSSARIGDQIELKHFLPIALGITLSLFAFVLGQ